MPLLGIIDGREASLAQSVEHRSRKAGVISSSLIAGSSASTIAVPVGRRFLFAGGPIRQERAPGCRKSPGCRTNPTGTVSELSHLSDARTNPTGTGPKLSQKSDARANPTGTVSELSQKSEARTNPTETGPGLSDWSNKTS